METNKSITIALGSIAAVVELCARGRSHYHYYSRSSSNVNNDDPESSRTGLCNKVTRKLGAERKRLWWLDERGLFCIFCSVKFLMAV